LIFHAALSEGASISDGHQTAIEGWKARKDQLHRQQQSVTEINDEAERVNLVSLSQKKGAE
jgi:hypothetical protein